MAVGMAAGTRFYLFATIFTLFISFLAVAFHRYRFGESGIGFYVLRLRMKSDFREPIEGLFADSCSAYALVSLDRMAGLGESDDFVYEINLKKGVGYENIVDRIGAVSEEISIALLVGEASVNV